MLDLFKSHIRISRLKKLCDIKDDEIRNLTSECRTKDAIIKHLIDENSLLICNIVEAKTSKLTATDLQRFKEICKLDFPATTKVEKPENKIY